MNTRPPLVSVVIPTQNRDLYLLEAIKSINNQTYDNIEIIVVDDDSTEPVCLSNLQSNLLVTLIRNEYPVGGAGSRNIGFTSSKGDFICFLDDDDLYDSGKIEILLSVIKSNKADVAFGTIIKFKEAIGSTPCKSTK